MIDIITHRIRIGTHHSSRHNTSLESNTKSQIPNFSFHNIQCNCNRFYFNCYCYCKLNRILLSLIYFTIIIYLSAVKLSLTLATQHFNQEYVKVHYARTSNLDINFLVILIQLLSIIIYRLRSKHERLTLPLVFSHLKHSVDGRSTIVYRSFRKYLVWLTMANLMLLTQCNSSIKNPGPVKNLSVFYQNVQGLIPVSELGKEHPSLNENKLLELQAYVYQQSPDIIVLNETWLKSSVNDNELFPPEYYKIFRRDRSPLSHPPDPNNPDKFRKHGGGVLIAVKSSLDITIKNINTECKAEVLSLELTLKNNTKLCLSTVYRVGTLGTSNQLALQEYFSSILRNRKYSKMYVIGDLNLPDLNVTQWSSGIGSIPLSQSFLDMFNNMCFEQCIEQATHRHGKILDILLTNSPQSLARVSVGDENSVCVSDHYPVFFDIKANVRRRKAIKREIFNYKKADWNSLSRDLSNTPWHSLLSSPYIETCWHNFKLTLDNLSKKHIPVIKSKDGFKPPWFDSDVYDICREKERIRLELKALKKKRDPNQQTLTSSDTPSLNQSPLDRLQIDKILRLELKFQSTRREMKRLIRSKMHSNFSDKQSENAITKKFWSYVKASSNSHRIPEIVHYNDIFKSDFKDQADLFNNFFYEQFSSQSNYDIDIKYNNSNQVYFSVSEVKNILKNLDPNKAPGPDQIHGKILKNCASALCTPLTLLFQSSFYTCSIPTDWKSANVVPVYKKGSKNSVQNYRPISLTSLIMKVYEKVLAAELLKRVNNKINPWQHGFLPLKSCESQLLPFVDELARTLNQGSRTDIVYFDFAKAFDSVNHDILLDKLKNRFGIDGFLLKFFVEYLSGRKQRVVIGNTFSDDMNVTSGVPQGSILGPLLFVLFINDIGDSVDKNSNILLYADDTKLFREIRSENDSKILQGDIAVLNDWALENKMKFHPDKCKVLTVSLQRNSELKFVYKLDQTPLQHVQSEKDLGVSITSNLCWTKHCNNLCSKAKRNLGLLRRTCSFVKNTRQRRSLYLAMIRSQFEHCSSVWASCSQTMLESIELIQKRSIKWVLREEFESYSTCMYMLKCKQLDLLPLKSRLVLKDLKLFHSMIIGTFPSSLPKYLHFHKSNNRLRSSHLDDFSIVSDISPRITVNYNKPATDTVSSSLTQFSSSFYFRTMNAWNSLPLEIRKITSPALFEQSVAKNLWEQLDFMPVEE